MNHSPTRRKRQPPKNPPRIEVRILKDDDNWTTMFYDCESQRDQASRRDEPIPQPYENFELYARFLERLGYNHPRKLEIALKGEGRSVASFDTSILVSVVSVIWNAASVVTVHSGVLDCPVRGGARIQRICIDGGIPFNPDATLERLLMDRQDHSNNDMSSKSGRSRVLSGAGTSKVGALPNLMDGMSTAKIIEDGARDERGRLGMVTVAPESRCPQEELPSAKARGKKRSKASRNTHVGVPDHGLGINTTSRR